MRKKQVLGSPLEHFTRNMFTEIIAKLSVFMAKNNFSVSEIAALHVIQKHKRLPIQKIAKYIGLSASATSRLLAGLEKQKLLVRRDDQTDSRIKYISCSKNGIIFLNNLSIERVAAAREVLKELPSEDKSLLFNTINDIRRGEII